MSVTARVAGTFRQGATEGIGGVIPQKRYVNYYSVYQDSQLQISASTLVTFTRNALTKHVFCCSLHFTDMQEHNCMENLMSGLVP